MAGADAAADDEALLAAAADEPAEWDFFTFCCCCRTVAVAVAVAVATCSAPGMMKSSGGGWALMTGETLLKPSSPGGGGEHARTWHTSIVSRPEEDT